MFLYKNCNFIQNKLNVAVLRHDLYFYYENENSIVHSNWTPQRLDDLEAIQEQLTFFEEKQLPETWKMTAVSHLFILRRMIDEVKHADPTYKKYIPILRREPRRAVHRYQKEIGLNIRGNEWIYETIYPGKMKIYWIYKSFCRRLGMKSEFPM